MLSTRWATCIGEFGLLSGELRFDRWQVLSPLNVIMVINRKHATCALKY
jgi:hypothetical protein